MNAKKHTILIADRNSRVREFLRRELAAAGYRICLAENGGQALKKAYGNESVDLMILDPDLPDIDESSLLIELQNRIPILPVVFHAFPTDLNGASMLLKPAAVVEKGGSSIEILKQAIHAILKKTKLSHVDNIE